MERGTASSAGRRRWSGSAAALAAAGSGRGSTVLVGGEAGIGKSRVAAELAARARDQGWLVLAGHCIDLIGAGVPYLPVAEAIRSLRGSSALGDGSRALPDLSRLVADLAEPAGATGQRPAVPMFRRGCSRMCGPCWTTLSAETPVLLVLEDLHWADSSTLDLVTFLAHVVAGSRVLVLATYRSDEARPDQPLQRLTTGLLRARTASAVDLGPLTEDEVTALLDGIAQGPVPRRPDRHDRPALGGKSLLRRGAVRRRDPRRAGPAARAAGRARAARSAGSIRASRMVLRTAAAAGRDVSYGLLAAVVPLAEAGAAGRPAGGGRPLLLVPDPDAGTFRFRHALLAEAVYQTLLPGERETVHARLAATLARAAPPGRDRPGRQRPGPPLGRRRPAGRGAGRVGPRGARRGGAVRAGRRRCGTPRRR